jgi:hypothetical protein
LYCKIYNLKQLWDHKVKAKRQLQNPSTEYTYPCWAISNKADKVFAESYIPSQKWADVKVSIEVKILLSRILRSVWIVRNSELEASCKSWSSVFLQRAHNSRHQGGPIKYEIRIYNGLVAGLGVMRSEDLSTFEATYSI